MTKEEYSIKRAELAATIISGIYTNWNENRVMLKNTGTHGSDSADFALDIAEVILKRSGVYVSDPKNTDNVLSIRDRDDQV